MKLRLDYALTKFSLVKGDAYISSLGKTVVGIGIDESVVNNRNNCDSEMTIDDLVYRRHTNGVFLPCEPDLPVDVFFETGDPDQIIASEIAWQNVVAWRPNIDALIEMQTDATDVCKFIDDVCDAFTSVFEGLFDQEKIEDEFNEDVKNTKDTQTTILEYIKKMKEDGDKNKTDDELVAEMVMKTNNAEYHPKPKSYLGAIKYDMSYVEKAFKAAIDATNKVKADPVKIDIDPYNITWFPCDFDEIVKNQFAPKREKCCSDECHCKDDPRDKLLAEIAVKLVNFRTLGHSSGAVASDIVDHVVMVANGYRK